MTIFGKTLVFLNLIFGIGVAVYSTAIYTHRPGWHDDLKDEPIAKGQLPMNFKQLSADIASQGNAAAVANANWGSAKRALDAAEANRTARHVRMFGTLPDGKTRPGMAKGLIDYAREGGLTPDGAAFLNLVEDSNTRLLNLNPDLKTAIVKGPDEQPLKGTETLLDQFVKDSAESEVQALLSKKLRAEQKVLGDQIVVVQNQIYKQRDIRDHQLVEASRLEAFEVNATEHQETVNRRRNQLIERLAPFRSMGK